MRGKLQRGWEEEGRREVRAGRKLPQHLDQTGLIREWLADLPPAPQLNQNGRGLFMILTGVWAGPSNFLPAERGQTQTAGLGGKEDITLSSGEAQCPLSRLFLSRLSFG